MSDFSCKAVTAQMDAAVGKHTAAHTTTQRHEHKVLHAVSGTVGMFAQSPCVGVVTQCHRHTQTVTQHGCKGNDTLPWHVRSILNTACHRVGTGAAHANGTNLLSTAVGI